LFLNFEQKWASCSYKIVCYFAEAGLFLNFEQKWASCSYKIVLVKNKCLLVNSLWNRRHKNCSISSTVEPINFYLIGFIFIILLFLKLVKYWLWKNYQVFLPYLKIKCINKVHDVCCCRYYKSYFEMQDIECDGRKVNSQRDPPGQRSVYVPPGKLCFKLV